MQGIYSYQDLENCISVMDSTLESNFDEGKIAQSMMTLTAIVEFLDPLFGYLEKSAMAYDFAEAMGLKPEDQPFMLASGKPFSFGSLYFKVGPEELGPARQLAADTVKKMTEIEKKVSGEFERVYNATKVRKWLDNPNDDIFMRDHLYGQGVFALFDGESVHSQEFDIKYHPGRGQYQMFFGGERASSYTELGLKEYLTENFSEYMNVVMIENMTLCNDEDTLFKIAADKYLKRFASSLPKGFRRN